MRTTGARKEGRHGDPDGRAHPERERGRDDETEHGLRGRSDLRGPRLAGSAWLGVERQALPDAGDEQDHQRCPADGPQELREHRSGHHTGWWSAGARLVPTVLLRSGLAFDVFSVAQPLAKTVLDTPAFRNNPGPVVFRPDQGRAYFMVTPGEIPASGFGGNPGEIELMASGSWILVPSAQMGTAINAAWWVSPHRVNWKVARFDIVRDVLKVAVKNRTLLPPEV